MNTIIDITIVFVCISIIFIMVSTAYMLVFLNLDRVRKLDISHYIRKMLGKKNETNSHK